MTMLLEDPVPIIFIGIVVEAVLGVAFMRTGRGAILLAMLGVLILASAGVAIEWIVVTEVEQVEAALDEAAAAVEANDPDRAMSYLASSFDNPARGWIRWVLARFEFSTARITNLEVTSINHLTSPPTAKARFIGVGHFTDREGQYPYRTQRVRFTVELHLEGGRWLVADLSEHDSGWQQTR